MLKSVSTFVTSVAVAAATVVVIPAASAQAFGTLVVSLTDGTASTQTFDSLAVAGTSGVLPDGWYVEETGMNANLLYTAGTGSVNAGDSYSFGAAPARSAPSAACSAAR